MFECCKNWSWDSIPARSLFTVAAVALLGALGLGATALGLWQFDWLGVTAGLILGGLGLVALFLLWGDRLEARFGFPRYGAACFRQLQAEFQAMAQVTDPAAWDLADRLLQKLIARPDWQLRWSDLAQQEESMKRVSSIPVSVSLVFATLITVLLGVPGLAADYWHVRNVQLHEESHWGTSDGGSTKEANGRRLRTPRVHRRGRDVVDTSLPATIQTKLPGTGCLISTG